MIRYILTRVTNDGRIMSTLYHSVVIATDAWFNSRARKPIWAVLISFNMETLETKTLKFHHEDNLENTGGIK